MTAAGPTSCSDDFVDGIKEGQVGSRFTLKEFGTYVSKSLLKSIAYASYPAALYYVFTSKNNTSKRIFIGLSSLVIMRDIWQFANNQIKMETGGSIVDLITTDDDD